MARRKTFLVRLPPELLDDLKAWAGHELRSLNAQIEFILREALRKRKGRPKDGPFPPVKGDPDG